MTIGDMMSNYAGPTNLDWDVIVIRPTELLMVLICSKILRIPTGEDMTVC
jgi:hypothetical protein